MSTISLPDGVTLDLGEIIGRGSSGVVHRGTLHARGGDREVAVKMLGAGSSARQQHSFLKEIEKSSVIGSRCDGVVKIYGVLQHAGQTCMVMKLYQHSLADRLERDGKQPLKEALGYAAQIARALKSVHSQGVAVLDLKPANLLFDEDGVLNISDFGISRVEDLTMTATATAAGGRGTPAYMAAEQHDPGTYGLPGPAADIWALGCVLLELVTGSKPWTGVSPLQIQMQVAMKGNSPPIPADVTKPIADILNRCFVVQQEGRARAAELLHMIDSAVEDPAALGTVSFCFSYASNGASRVEEAKKELEARGHRVFYGKDVSAQVDADWRKQWCIECNAAQFCVNFLSAAYIRSDSCAQEWSFCSRNKAASSIINVVVGGRDAQEKLMAVLLDEVADKGGMNIRLHFETGGRRSQCTKLMISQK